MFVKDLIFQTRTVKIQNQKMFRGRVPDRKDNHGRHY